MSDSLTNFLIDLAVDHERRTRYAEDAAAEMDRAGLSSADQEALLSRDSSRVRRALGHPDNDTMTQAAIRKRRRKGAPRRKGKGLENAVKRKPTKGSKKR